MGHIISSSFDDMKDEMIDDWEDMNNGAEKETWVIVKHTPEAKRTTSCFLRLSISRKMGTGDSCAYAEFGGGRTLYVATARDSLTGSRGLGDLARECIGSLPGLPGKLTDRLPELKGMPAVIGSWFGTVAEALGREYTPFFVDTKGWERMDSNKRFYAILEKHVDYPLLELMISQAPDTGRWCAVAGIGNGYGWNSSADGTATTASSDEDDEGKLAQECLGKLGKLPEALKKILPQIGEMGVRDWFRSAVRTLAKENGIDCLTFFVPGENGK